MLTVLSCLTYSCMLLTVWLTRVCCWLCRPVWLTHVSCSTYVLAVDCLTYPCMLLTVFSCLTYSCLLLTVLCPVWLTRVCCWLRCVPVWLTRVCYWPCCPVLLTCLLLTVSSRFDLFVYDVDCVVSCLTYSRMLLTVLCAIDCVVSCLTYSGMMLALLCPVWLTRVCCWLPCVLFDLLVYAIDFVVSC